MKKFLTILATLIFLFLFRPLLAHEPLFGLGPHTLYQYGFALETELEMKTEGWIHKFEALYGITPDWAVTLSSPYDLSQSKAGFGNVGVRTKFRFFRKDLVGASKQAALHAGVFLPSGKALNATDFFLGLSYGYESRRHYFFSGLRYRLNESSKDMQRFDEIFFNLAYGIRPWLLEYLQPDPVLLVEVNSTFNNDLKTADEFNNYAISISPGILFSYRNIMLKIGAKFPVLHVKAGMKNEYILGLEFHFPPIF